MKYSAGLRIFLVLQLVAVSNVGLANKSTSYRIATSLPPFLQSRFFTQLPTTPAAKTLGVTMPPSTSSTKLTHKHFTTNFFPWFKTFFPSRRTPWFSTTTYAPLSNSTWHCQFHLVNDYHNTTEASGRTVEDYARDLRPRIATVCGVDVDRISNVKVQENPDTGQLVLSFSVLPPRSDCQVGCEQSALLVVEKLTDLVGTSSFRLTDVINQTLRVNSKSAFYLWTDDGPCPNAPCEADHVCRCRPTGQFYCQCVTNCGEKKKFNERNLWALMIIPLVVIVVLVVVLVYLLYKRRRTASTDKKHKTVRDYQYDISTVKDSTGIPTLDPGATNRLYRSLGRSLGIAFNEKSFSDAEKGSSSGDSVVAPF